MSIQIKCSKCGEPINVEVAQMEEASKLGVPLDIKHEVCPKDRDTIPLYEVRVSVTKFVTGERTDEGQQLFYVAPSVYGPTLKEKWSDLRDKVNEALTKVEGMVSIIEVEDALTNETPTKENADAEDG